MLAEGYPLRPVGLVIHCSVGERHSQERLGLWYRTSQWGLVKLSQKASQLINGLPNI